MTTIEDVLTYIDGSNANGRLVVAWKPFTVGNVNAAGGELEWPIVDGAVSISLYANTGALPTGSYYVAKYELENGAVYLEQWVVPNLPTVNLGQVRVSFPPSPSVMISPLQLTSLGATPGMFLMWDGQRWVPGYPSTFNLDPNWIGVAVGSSGNDISVTNPQVHLGNSFTINIPDAGPAARGVVTTSPQSFGGVKTFLNTVQISTSIQFALRAVSPVYGELLGFGTGGADSSLAFGGNIFASRVSPVDRPYMRADHFIGSNLDLETFGDPPTAVMPGSLANPARNLAALLLPVAGTVDWTGIGTDTAGALWLRTGTSTAAGFLYLDTAGNVTAREFRMDPYQHLNAPGAEAARSDATMVMYSGASDWAGYGVNSTPEMWFRMGPNAAGAYYYFGAGGARFPGNLTVGSIVVTGGVTLPAGTYVPTSRKINTPVGTGLTGGGDLTVDRTLTVVDNTTTQRVETAQTGTLKAVRKRLNFIAGAGQLITVVDDSANDQANVTITSSTSGSATPSIYSVNGTPVGTQPELNLVAGSNVILNGANNSGLNRVDITVTTAGGAAITDPTTAVGDLIVRGTVTPSPLTRLAAGTTTGYVLTTDLSTAPFIKWADRVPITRQIIAGAGLGGGGALGGIAATDVTLTANVLSVNGQTGAVTLTAANVGGVPTTRQIIAGTGLSGGGPLSSDVTLAVVNDTVTERVRISNAGTLIGTRQQINFIQGANISLTVADVPGSNWVGVTVAATTSGLSDPTTTKGDLIVRPVGPPATRMGVGATDGMVLTVDSTDATFGIKWKVVPLSPQTPWASDIDGANFKLKNVGRISIGNDGSVIPGGAATDFVLLVGNTTVVNGPYSALISAGNTSNIGDQCGSVSFANYNLAAADKRLAAINCNTDGALNSGSLLFYTWSAGSVGARVLISAAGNVGIGNGGTTPGYRLDVTVNGINDVMRIGNIAGSAKAYLDFVTYNYTVQGGGVSARIGAVDVGSFNAALVFEVANTSTATTSTTELMRIMPTGYVGIGTTNPSGPLSLYSGALANLWSWTNMDQGCFAFYQANNFPTTNSFQRVLDIVAGGFNAGGNIRFVTQNNGAAGVTAMLINPAGQVGIGMTNPGTALDVAGLVRASSGFSTTAKGNLFGTANGPLTAIAPTDACIKLYDFGTGNWNGMGADGGGNMWFRVGTSGTSDARMVIQPSGNVGIGMTAPSGRLSITASGAWTPSSTISGIALAVGGAFGGGISMVDGSAQFTMYGASGLFYFACGTLGGAFNGSLTFDGSGQVGIAKSPGFRLDVAGDINTTGVFRISGLPCGTPNSSAQYGGGGSSRGLNGVYQNNYGKLIFVNVYAIVMQNSYIRLLTDAGNPPTGPISAWTNTAGSNITGGGSVSGWVLPGNFYKVETPNATLQNWTESV